MTEQGQGGAPPTDTTEKKVHLANTMQKPIDATVNMGSKEKPKNITLRWVARQVQENLSPKTLESSDVQRLLKAGYLKDVSTSYEPRPKLPLKKAK